jgi:ferredoxin-type protein NapG
MTKIKFGRRDFFSRSFNSVKRVSLEAIDVGLKLKFKRKIIRPPGAIREDRFLMTCSRCDLCMDACPYNAIHKIESVSAGVLMNTPFIDPLFEACRFCEDMPCIKACEDEALILIDEIAPIGLAVVHKEHCLVYQGQRCDYCFNSCPNGLKAISKSEDGTPSIDAETCVGCGKCAYICVSQSDRAITILPLA